MSRTGDPTVRRPAHTWWKWNLTDAKPLPGAEELVRKYGSDSDLHFFQNRYSDIYRGVCVFHGFCVGRGVPSERPMPGLPESVAQCSLCSAYVLRRHMVEGSTIELADAWAHEVLRQMESAEWRR